MRAKTEDPLISALLEAGLLDEQSRGRLQRARNSSGESPVILIQQLGMIEEGALTRFLSEHCRVPVADSAAIRKDYPLKDVLPQQFLQRMRMIPIAVEDGRVVVAAADPSQSAGVEALRYKLGQSIDVTVAPLSAIDAALSFQDAPSSSQGYGAEIGESDLDALRDIASGAPVVRFVSAIIERAVRENASDIHFEPTEDHLRIRLRINGALRDIDPAPHAMKLAVISRLKILARLDIAETRLPQDGRARVSVRGSEIDLRISTSPTLQGEGVVVRLLDKSALELNFKALGFSASNVAIMEKMLARPNGLFLVTGPTGSGKTTSLYAALVQLNDPTRKIFSVEDPVEYRIAGVNQIQVNPKIGLSFATTLRSLLRQDPDIMMVGEIRDSETANIAVQAALTGHLVLATLHTNSAAASISRLIDMGVEEYLLAASLTGVAAQRLVGVPCEACAQTQDAPDFVKDAANNRKATVLHAVGCTVCGGSGYTGRTTISEILAVTPQLREAISRRDSEDVIERIAAREGMVSMFDDGVQKVLAGQTTVEELLRAVKT